MAIDPPAAKLARLAPASTPSGRAGSLPTTPITPNSGIPQTALSLTHSTTAAHVNAAELDPIRRTFGGLYDSEEPTEVSKQQYDARRALADFASYPEGCEFCLRLVGEEPRAVILLTPPSHVAVRNADGSWERKRRNSQAHGPAPYTNKWYTAYLRQNNLPFWFLNNAHLSMIDDETEAERLGVQAHPQPQQPVPDAYLATRYPSTPKYPMLAGVSGHQDYQYALSEEEQLHLARHFPATNLLGPDRRIVIKPGGYIFIHENLSIQNYPRASSDQIRWSTTAADKASYVVEGAAANPQQQTADAGERSKLAAEKSASDGFVNLSEHPAGVGAWEWLDANVDEAAAKNLGFDHPHQIGSALLQGRLQLGRGPYAAPSVVYRPQADLFNKQNNQPGKWEFFTEASREKAQADFGGQAAYGLAGVLNPSAADIWSIRKTYQDAIADVSNTHDPTAEIDLIWVAGRDESGEDETDLTSEMDTAMSDVSEMSPAAKTPPDGPLPPSEPDEGHGHDRETGLAHSPKNEATLGPDQTASDGGARYFTRKIRGKKVTLDRARAHSVKEGQKAQTHRMHIYTKGGKWESYKDAIDWSSEESVEKMNKWREQACKRNEWAAKRGVVQSPYTQEQRDWTFKKIEQAGGKMPKETSTALSKEFNAHFELEGENVRKSSGVMGLFTRSLKEYQANGGKQKPRRAPAAKKSKAKAKGKASAESPGPSKLNNVENAVEMEVKKADEGKEASAGAEQADVGGDKMDIDAKPHMPGGDETEDEDAPHELEGAFD